MNPHTLQMLLVAIFAIVCIIAAAAVAIAGHPALGLLMVMVAVFASATI